MSRCKIIDIQDWSWHVLWVWRKVRQIMDFKARHSLDTSRRCWWNLSCLLRMYIYIFDFESLRAEGPHFLPPPHLWRVLKGVKSFNGKCQDKVRELKLISVWRVLIKWTGDSHWQSDSSEDQTSLKIILIGRNVQRGLFFFFLSFSDRFLPQLRFFSGSILTRLQRLKGTTIFVFNPLKRRSWL